MSDRNNLYYEKWIVPFVPLVFFLPCFYTYSVVITQDELIFGYGLLGPWKGITAHRVPRKDIKRVYSGTWTWKENLMNLGGWGIRYGRIATETSSSQTKRGWAYNASNGTFVVIQVTGDKSYQFVTKEPDKVKQLLASS